MSKRFLKIIIGLESLLLIPFIAMQFSEEVQWKLNDFLIMAALLFGLGLGIDFLLRKLKSPKKRWIAGIFLLLCFLLIWAELAVGIFGTPFAGS
jgi:hypothetical protein